MFRSIVEHSYAGIYTSDDNFRFSYVNDKLCEISGYTREELLGMDLRQLAAEESLPIVADRYVRRRNGEPVPLWYTFTGIHKNGERCFLETSVAVVIGSTGVKRTIGQIHDITERKRAEEALRESQQQLVDIIDFLPDATLVIDKEGNVIAWNRAIEAMTGVKKADMLGKGNKEYALPFYGDRRPILIDLALHPDPEMEKFYTTIQREGDILIW